MNISCVYSIRSPSGKFYIGSARNFETRKRVHLNALRKGKHHSRPLQRAWDKYGVLDFSVLVICSESTLFLYEQSIIDRLRPAYNVNPSACGTRGLRWSEESKAKIRGRKVDPALISQGVMRCTTPEQRRANSKYARSQWTEESKLSQVIKLTGRRDTAETRTKKIAALTGRPVSEETRRKIAAHAGWKHTDIAKAKMRQHVRTAEHSAAIAASNCGNKNRLGHKGSGGKPVICMQTRQVFQSMGLAVDWLKSLGKTKAQDGGISLACNGYRKSAYGYGWRFASSVLNSVGYEVVR